MYLGATYPGSVGGAVELPTVGQGFVSLVLGATGVGSSKQKGTGATTPLALAIVGVGKSVKRGVGLAALQLSATGVGEKIEEASAEGFAPLFLFAEGLGAGEGEYYGEARPDETLTPGDWIPLNIASLEQAVNDSNDGTYAQSQVVGTTRTIELLEGSTVRATRTIESGGGAWVEEEFLLSGVEKASITAWSDIRLRITDGGTPVVYGFPALITPPSNVEIYVRTRLEALVNGYSLKTSLVGFWELEEAGSTTRLDSHGPNHLNETNATAQGTGKVGNCADFEASSNNRLLCLSPTSALASGDVDYTIALWAKLESKPSTQSMTLAAKADLSFADADFWLWWDWATDSIRFRLYPTGDHTGAVEVTASTFGAPAIATWYFIVAWHDSVANTINIQINNGAVDSVSHSGGMFDSGGEFFLGNNELGYKYDGLLDQVGIWKRVLSANEKTWLYNLGVGRAYSELGPAVQGADLLEDLISLWELHEPSGVRYDAHGTNHLTPVSILLTQLKAFWELEETSGTRNDSHGTNHLTDNNTVTSNPGKVGTAAQFTRVNGESLSIADNANLSGGDTDFTVQAWVYLDSKSGDSLFVAKRGVAASDKEYLLWYYSAVDRFVFWVPKTGSYAPTPVLAPSTGTWYHLIGWHDAANDQVGLDINAAIPTVISASGGAYDAAAAFTLGSDVSGDNVYHNGRLDQVAFWRRVLSSGERAILYNGGNGLSYAALATAAGIVGSATGKVGNCGTFTAAQLQSLSIPDNAPLSVGDIDFTFAGWVYFNSLGSARNILGKTGGFPDEYQLVYSGSGGSARFTWSVVPPGFASSGISANSFGAATTGVWYFFTVWHDSVNNLIGIAINAGTADTVSFADGVRDGTHPFQIGNYSAGSAFALDGRVDQVGFWKRVLTAAERTWLYNDGNGRAYSEMSGITTLTNLIAFWAFENGSNLGQDSHGAIDMTNVNAVTAVAGLVGNALDVEYSSVGHLSVADPPFTYIGDGDWTIMAWVKLESSASLYSIISKGDSSDPEWHLQFNNTGSKFRLQAYAAAAGASGTILTSTVTTGTGLWHLILAWHDADAGTIHLQINDNAPESTAHAGGAYNGDGPITIGTDASGNRFDGLIDQVAIWARKLSSDERRWLYNAGAGRAYSELGSLLT